MTQGELITKWREEADALEREADDQSNYMTGQERGQSYDKAEILRSCANDLSAMTY